MSVDDLIVEFKDVNFSHGALTVLENISFTVKRGDYLGVIGPNGGGKTSLLRILVGLDKPDTGAVKLFGEDIASLSGRHRLGYVPQRVSQRDFFFPASVQEIVVSGRTPGLGLFKRYGADDKRAVEQAIDIAGLGALRTRPMGELSGGERQRVFIARALAGSPELLILDEPSVGVDVGAQQKFYEFLSTLNKDLGITVLFVSHDVSAIVKEITSVLCLNRTLVCHGTSENINTPDFMENLYGHKVSTIYHDH